ncbi:lytic polysaccharide monooxygenase [Streptomyces lunaelactis]|uniref:lytic polysaccharide monooxygenase auxiliary activity family 9 protein n=1 Tax=Streptomyces lunaelactis TaxID=1535768 RepID=UPI001584ECB4|nr:lytic polysaccharide monooxygenase [Streptomyces lunaelactis]NUL02883.1 lytic polysaccharide monooxygenase [Streptomyces lunaelactis]
MTAHRTAAAVAFAGVVPLVLTAVAAGTAQAHGAPTDPVSRVAACGPEGAQRASAACRAAVAANGGSAFDAWDNLRVADVRGRDREVVPDGQLCSAGLDAYRGLDIARADWPATTLKAGSRFTLTYRSTIPHEGSFSLYLTKKGHDPAAPLRWADLAAEPFATATDPELSDGAYRISGRLPAGLTGRHVLYTVWRNSSTPDTYYSCSDVVLAGAAKPGDASGPDSGSDSGAVAEQPATEPSPTREPASEQPSAQPAAEPAQQPVTQPVTEPAAQPAAASADRGDDESVILIGGAAAALALVALVVSAVLRRRPRRHAHRGSGARAHGSGT